MIFRSSRHSDQNHDERNQRNVEGRRRHCGQYLAYAVEQETEGANDLVCNHTVPGLRDTVIFINKNSLSWEVAPIGKTIKRASVGAEKNEEEPTTPDGPTATIRQQMNQD